MLDCDLDLVAVREAADDRALGGAESRWQRDVSQPRRVGVALTVLEGHDLARIDRAAAAEADEDGSAQLVDQVQRLVDVGLRRVLADRAETADIAGAELDMSWVT